jgi:hypothetical protein
LGLWPVIKFIKYRSFGFVRPDQSKKKDKSILALPNEATCLVQSLI